MRISVQSLGASVILEAKQIGKSFTNRGKKVVGKEKRQSNLSVVLEDISFKLREGSLTSIIGPSGCGKTTLLRIVDGLIRPTSGQVIFKGNLVSSPPRKMGFVFQQFGLFPWRTVIANAEFGLELRGVSSVERKEAARQYLDLVGLTGFEDHYVHELSGGMQQRVALARALAIDPDVLLMDEPFASVDEQTREILQKELLQIVKGKAPKTTLLVTHNVDEAIYLSDEIILLSSRPGKIREVVEVRMPEDRWKIDLRSRPEYANLRKKIWSFLEEEIRQEGVFAVAA